MEVTELAEKPDENEILGFLNEKVLPNAEQEKRSELMGESELGRLDEEARLLWKSGS